MRNASDRVDGAELPFDLEEVLSRTATAIMIGQGSPTGEQGPTSGQGSAREDLARLSRPDPMTANVVRRRGRPKSQRAPTYQVDQEMAPKLLPLIE